MNIDNVNTLQRYKAIACSSQTGGCLEENLNGNAVLYEDVVRLVNNHPAKKKFKEPSSILMIDIETLDTAVTAQVVEVAMLCMQNRVQSKKFHAYIDLDADLTNFFTQSKSTMEFHINSNTEVLENHLRAVVQDRAIKMSELIQHINSLTSVTPNDTMIYCFGLNFDIPILSYVAQQTNTKLQLPSYRNLRCLRTELATAEALGFTYAKKPTAHNAFEDCHAQVELLFSIFDFYKDLANGTNN